MHFAVMYQSENGTKRTFSCAWLQSTHARGVGSGERPGCLMSKAKLIENVLPPVIYRALLRIYLLTRGHGWNIFYGCYPTLADVPSDPKGQNSDWYTASAAKEVEPKIRALSSSNGRRDWSARSPSRFVAVPLWHRGGQGDRDCAGLWRRRRRGT
jgi:hypothetical protein